MWILLLRDSYVLQIRSFRSEDHPYRYKKTYEKVHNISPLHRCFRCDALLECARPGGFRIANWDPPRRVPRGPSGVWNHAAPDTSQKVGKYTSGACIFHRKRSFLYSRFRGPFSQLALGLDSQQGFLENQWFRLEATRSSTYVPPAAGATWNRA